MTLTSLLLVALSAALGALGWSLAEYWIHRELGHHHTRNLFGKEHIAHHGKGDYFAAWWKKGGAALIAALLMIGPAVWLAGPAMGGAFVAGFVGFYLTYETIHRLEHVSEGVGPYARWARSHHFHHHFHNPRCNHGVTSPLWDHVFGTYEQPAVVQVPRKMAMRWLCDPTTGEVRSHLRGRFALR